MKPPNWAAVPLGELSLVNHDVLAGIRGQLLDLSLSRSGYRVTAAWSIRVFSMPPGSRWLISKDRR
jgi:hypothetical protein